MWWVGVSGEVKVAANQQSQNQLQNNAKFITVHGIWAGGMEILIKVNQKGR